MGALSFFMIIAVFAGLGQQDILIREIARNAENEKGFIASTATWTLGSALPLSIIGVAVIRFAVSQEIQLSLAIELALSEVVLSPLISIAESIYVGRGSMGPAGLVRVYQSIARAFIPVVLVFAISHFSRKLTISASDWGAGLLIANVLVLFFYCVKLPYRIGRLSVSKSLHHLRDGVFLSCVQLISAANNNVDRVLVVRSLPLGLAGTYAAASRASQFGSVPIGAILRTSYARFFHSHAQAAGERLTYALTVAGTCFFVAVAIAISGTVASPILAFFVGAKYQGIAPLFCALLWVLPASAVNSALGDALVGLN